MNSYQIGDTVFILCKRMDGGCVYVPPEHPEAPSYPVVECQVAQTALGGSEGCYGLVWADNGEPVGLPFYGRSLFKTSEDLKARIEACQVAL